LEATVGNEKIRNTCSIVTDVGQPYSISFGISLICSSVRYDIIFEQYTTLIFLVYF